MIGGFKLMGAFFMLAAASAPAAAPPGEYAARLRAECDALIDAAVQRGYGWAWGESSGNVSSPRAAPIPVRFEPLTSPAGAIVLLSTYDLLNDERYKHAAQQAARGVAAGMEGSGRVPNRANFGKAPVGIDALSASPDRAPTIASLALLLTLHARRELPDERTGRAAVQMARWLLRQQTHSGAWPTAHPPDARPNDAQRVIRLDQSGYRDATLAMVLANDVLKNSLYDRAGVRAIDQLLRLRVEERGAIGRGLWRSMYELDGSLPTKIPEATRDIDALASRYALQTLLSAYVLTGERELGLSADEAVKIIETLRQPDGTWKRTYGPGPSRRPADEPPLEDIWSFGWFGLDEVVKSTRELKLLGREKFVKLLDAGFDARQQIVHILCGLSDSTMTLDFPISREEIAPYLGRHEQMWRLLEGEPPSDLPGRVQRLWVLYLRTRIERMQEKT